MSAVSIRALLTPAQYGAVLLALEEISNNSTGPGLAARKALDKILVGSRPKAAAAEHPNMKAMESRIRAEIAAEIRAEETWFRSREDYDGDYEDIGYINGIRVAANRAEKGPRT